jgi:putative inorganic carbon (HCO3(-)) transporter
VQLIKIRRDAGYLTLWIMAVIYPLVVVPYQFCVSFPSINQFFLSCFYAPRYILLAVLSGMALVVLVKDRAQVKHPVFISLGLFMFFAFLSALLAPEPAIAWIGSPFRYTGYTTYLFCSVLFTLAYRSSYAEQLLRYTVYTAVLVSFIALLQYLGLNPVPHEPYRDGFRSYSTLGNPDFLGSYLVLIWPAAVFFYLRDKEIRWLISSAVIYLGLVLSQTRSAWIAFFITFICIFFYTLRTPERKKPITLLAVALFVISCLFSFIQGGTIFPHKDGSIAREVAAVLRFEDDAGNGRVLIWKETVRLLPAHWAFGVGPDHLGYAGLIAKQQYPIDKAHNIFLEIAVTMGIFALLSYLAFLSFFIPLYRSEPGFMFFAMILAYLSQGLCNIEVIMVMPLFWIVLGLSLGVRQFV